RRGGRVAFLALGGQAVGSGIGGGERGLVLPDISRLEFGVPILALLRLRPAGNRQQQKGGEPQAAPIRREGLGFLVHEPARFAASRARIASWRASRRSARATTGMSIILPSIANEARPSAAALAFPSITRFAWATSSGEGEYSSFTMVTCPGWMQLAPRKPNWRDLRTIRRNASQSPNAATLAI